MRLDSPGGLLECSDAGSGNVTVDIGEPHLDWREIPLAQEVDTKSFVLTVDDAALTASAVSVGNPHCILFVEDAERENVAGLGPKIEHHPMFPARTNVEFGERDFARRACACGCGNAARASRWPAARAPAPRPFAAPSGAGLSESKVDVVLGRRARWRSNGAKATGTF